MQIPRIYTPQAIRVGQTLQLEPLASQHVLRVLRLRLDEVVIVFNGEGGEYRGLLAESQKNAAVIKITQFEDANRESSLAIHLIQGISRRERMDYVIQKSTELGVKSITPLFTERCMVKSSGDRLLKRQQHWQKVAIAAAEQSARCYIPTIKQAVKLTECLSHHHGGGFICHVDSSRTMNNFSTIKKEVTLLIGPEGGFTSLEIQSAKKMGFQSLCLGPRILRTETAPVVAMTLLQSKAGDL
jgi:16S rRNA (uracil1498-N3)-methyltransferase